ncbi:hypothetical protein MJO29_002882 [Puccinia striiformis f. sp. tritici]|nr:hypothetical protein MJO29_002882 [Puccinia striiformis f. sp. tritici]
MGVTSGGFDFDGEKGGIKGTTRKIGKQKFVERLDKKRCGWRVDDSKTAQTCSKTQVLEVV